jgi:hypothetical protein
MPVVGDQVDAVGFQLRDVEVGTDDEPLTREPERTLPIPVNQVAERAGLDSRLEG